MKDILRQEFKSIRKKISEREFKSEMIKEMLIQSDIWQQAEKIALYLSFGSEVGTEKIVQQGFLEKKIIAAPITDNESFAMEFYQILPQSATLKAKLGMQEPLAQKERLLKAEDIDLIILPGVAFDEKGHRLGMGKGCYDRYLPRLNQEAVKAALAFEGQIAKNELPYEKFDVLMDFVITEKRIIDCQKNRERIEYYGRQQ